jgi:uncharacterized membrane protein (UPF0127 family)
MRKLRFSKNMLVPVLIGIVVIAAIVTALIVGGGEAKPKVEKKKTVTTACGPYRTDKKIVIGGQTFNTEVVKSASELQKGLGGRPCILANQGMLFQFSKPGQIWIWMKDMKFPIDIVWISPGHMVVGVEQDVKPSTYPDKFVNRDKPAQFVLELQANRSQDLHIDLGTPVSF